MRYLLALAESFWQRWHAELDLRSLKSVPQMDVLRGKKPEMVQKELWTHLLSYNLIRKVMAQAGEVHHAAGAPQRAAGLVPAEGHPAGTRPAARQHFARMPPASRPNNPGVDARHGEGCVMTAAKSPFVLRVLDP